jgi:predicted PurR-regulated permease PerM
MRRPRIGTRGRDDDGPVAFEPRDLSGFFAAPRWLRDLGRSSWLAVGITLFVVAIVWLLALTHTIVAPLIAATVMAAVASPLVRWLRDHHVPRGVGAALVLVGAAGLAVGVVVIVLSGITSEVDPTRDNLAAAKDTIAQWLSDLGIKSGTADGAVSDVSVAVSDAVPALLKGVASGLQSLSGLAVFLSLTALSLFFLLLDGPTIRSWTERHMRVPEPVAHQMTGRVLQSLRGYFVGVAIVAAFNAAVVGLGALILGVPLAGTIAAVTFLGAFVPYLGAWTAGAFSVLLALGGAGTDAAAGMILIQLLANGILQQMVQPIAMGAALGIHPLAVLVVTIGGGALFGAVGLILAAPLTSAATRIAADLSRSGSGLAGASHAPRPAEVADDQ